MFACVLLPRADAELGRRLFAVSPLVECAGDAVFLDDAGLERLHGGAAGLFAAIRAALAPETPRGLARAANRFTAEVAARYVRRPVTVRAGEESLFLSRLPLSALPLPEGLARRLRPLGLETLGDFASLPVGAVERRYGQAGVGLHRLARGLDERGLLPDRERRVPSVMSELEAPADRLDRLLPVLEESLARLCGWLAEEGHGLTRLRLTMSLDAALDEVETEAREASAARCELVLSAPEDRPALLVDLLRLKLEADPPGAAVTGLALKALASTPMAVHQNALFGEVARDAARRAEALARLQTLFGRQAVATPRVRRAHRLEQRWELIEQRSPSGGAREPQPVGRTASGPALRVLEQPEPLVPILAGGRLAGFRRGQQQLRIARAYGPRRLTGGWWRTPWARDEYELLTPEGGRYRVCRDLQRQRWLLMAEAD
jgi:hypothetical protein